MTQKQLLDLKNIIKNYNEVKRITSAKRIIEADKSRRNRAVAIWLMRLDK